MMHIDLNDEIRANIHRARQVRATPHTTRMVSYRSFGECLESMARSRQDAPFLIYLDGDHRQEFSFRAFHEEVNRIARFLAQEVGVEHGDRVATLMHNHPRTVQVYFALWKLGAVVLPINAEESDERLLFMLQNAQVRVMFVLSDYAPRLEGLRDKLSAVERLILADGEPREGFDSLPARLSGFPPEFRTRSEVTLDSPALIVYTSGTTGNPKGVVLDQYNLLVDAEGICRWHAVCAETRLMGVLPIHHVNGAIVTLVTPLLAGGSVVLCRRFRATGFWSTLARERVHLVSVVPTLLAFLIEKGENAAAEDLSAFRHFICGAGPLSVGLAASFEARFKHKIIHGYGLSETTCYSCFLPLDLDDAAHRGWLQDHGFPSIGVPIHPNEMAIHDEQGVAQGEGQRGEIVIRGHNVMTGYHRRPEANSETFKHGWFRSGDEGFYRKDAKGRPFFFITGRIKELIIRGGVNLSPFEIDEVLMAIPGVKCGLAVPFPNKYYGEEVGAYVVPQEGVGLSAEDIVKAAARRLSFAKRPKVVVFGTQVPVTSTGKVQRVKLVPLFKDYENIQYRED